MIVEEQSEINYGVLSTDEPFVGTCENLKESLRKLQTTLKECEELRKNYDNLSTADKIELDLLTAFSYNSLYFVKLRIEGVDTVVHPIKLELARIKEAMTRWQMQKDKEMRPKVDKDAAKRFVKRGLWDPNQPPARRNKKTKFED